MILHGSYVSGCNSSMEQGHNYCYKSRICRDSGPVSCAYGSVWQTAWPSRLNTNMGLVRMQSFCPVSLFQALFLMRLPTLSAVNNEHSLYSSICIPWEVPEPLCTDRKTFYLCVYVASPPPVWIGQALSISQRAPPPQSHVIIAPFHHCVCTERPAHRLGLDYRKRVM